MRKEHMEKLRKTDKKHVKTIGKLQESHKKTKHFLRSRKGEDWELNDHEKPMEARIKADKEPIGDLAAIEREAFIFRPAFFWFSFGFL